MMGSKERHFAPLINVSVEELVPSDHFYRHLEKSLDLTFVYELVEKMYAGYLLHVVEAVVAPARARGHCCLGLPFP